MFHDEARHRWKPKKIILLQTKDLITWKSFLEKFHNKYFPNFICQQKDVEFMTLIKYTKTVAE